MGIPGLLPYLAPITREIHLSSLSSLSVGIDGYSWLHKGVFSCAFELVLDQQTTKHIDYFTRKIQLLQRNGIVPVVVFDGGNLSMKNGTESVRAERRKERRALGMIELKKGNKAKATEYFQTCIDVTPQMAAQVISALKLLNVKYEADAQLAHMSITEQIQAVITEDSDLLTFGCTRVIFKLKHDGSCMEIRADDFGNVPGMKNWTATKFRQMCIMAGCDYLPSCPGVGVKTAVKWLQTTTDAYTTIKSWNAWGVAIKAPKVPVGYMDNFKMAELTFLHQRVYSVDLECLVPLTPFPEGFELTREISEAVGEDLEPWLAKGIAIGEIDPETKLPFPVIEPVIIGKKSYTSMAKSAFSKQNSSSTTRLKPSTASQRSNLISSYMKPKNLVPTGIGAAEPPSFSRALSSSTLNRNLESEAKIAKEMKLKLQPQNVVSKHFSADMPSAPTAAPGYDDDIQVLEVKSLKPAISSSLALKTPFLQSFTKGKLSTPKKEVEKERAQQTKMFSFFSRPSLPRLSPLNPSQDVKENTGSNSRFAPLKVKASAVFNLKRPLATTESKPVSGKKFNFFKKSKS